MASKAKLYIHVPWTTPFLLLSRFYFQINYSNICIDKINHAKNTIQYIPILPNIWNVNVGLFVCCTLNIKPIITKLYANIIRGCRVIFIPKDYAVRKPCAKNSKIIIANHQFNYISLYKFLQPNFCISDVRATMTHSSYHIVWLYLPCIFTIYIQMKSPAKKKHWFVILDFCTISRCVCRHRGRWKQIIFWNDRTYCKRTSFVVISTFRVIFHWTIWYKVYYTAGLPI